MFCMNCGAKQPDNSVFCGSCGTRLNGPESVGNEKQEHQDQKGQTNSIHQMTQEMKNQVDAVDKQQVLDFVFGGGRGVQDVASVWKQGVGLLKEYLQLGFTAATSRLFDVGNRSSRTEFFRTMIGLSLLYFIVISVCGLLLYAEMALTVKGIKVRDLSDLLFGFASFGKAIEPGILAYLSLFLSIIIGIGNLTNLVRRAHDINKNGVWVLWPLVLVLIPKFHLWGSILTFVLMTWRIFVLSTTKDDKEFNQFGRYVPYTSVHEEPEISMELGVVYTVQSVMHSLMTTMGLVVFVQWMFIWIELYSKF